MDITRTHKSAAGIAGRAKAWATAHKFWSAIIVIAALIVIYYIYGALTSGPTATRYVTATVATSTVVETMTETGQVSASSNIAIDSQASGEILSVPVQPGEHVDAGAVLATIDPTAAQQSLENAEASLESAQISLAKLEEAAATSTLIDDQNAVANAQAQQVQAYDQAYDDVSSAFLNLPSVISGLNTILHGNVVPGRTYEENEAAYSDLISQYEPTVGTYEANAESSYQTAYTSFQSALATFNATPRDASDADMQTLINQSYQATASLSDAMKASTDFLSFVNTTLTNRETPVPSTLPTAIASLTTYTNEVNSSVSALSGDVGSVTTNADSLAAAQATLAQLQSGPDPLDVQSSELSIQQQQEAVAAAQQSLADTVVRAPFDGTVALIDVQQYQNIGNGTAVATMVSDNQNVDLSLNEVDAAKLQLGQKATLSFDAIPNVSIAGTVSQINTIGTVSSGVVTYDAVVTFDTPNTSVLPGMSASANIITNVATGLVVPASAVNTSATGQSYVQVFNPPLAGSSSTGVASATLPTQVPVTTGISNATDVLITSGLTSGEQVVTETIAGTQTTTAKSAAAQSTSILGGGARVGGGGFGGGGAGGAALRGL
jgi:HlyD family secretion protein